ncbi:MAG TPA: PadR family transcriptional regulator [Spirochaetota bacterium]|nr:PadR family transcriptional regulator [Spirochaetota bacterium]HPV40594.1 PadR family transcriptional regulator [Spirochaetota bacterium]
MSTKHMILGALMSGPAHGYSLKSESTVRVMEEFGINDGQLYPLLKKMTDEGLIRKEIEFRETGPNRHNYHITEAGREEFISWLTGAEGEERAFRYEMIRKDEFLNKCMYFRFLDAAATADKVRVQISETESSIRDFQDAYDDMKSRDFDNLHLMIVRYCIMSLETRLKWLMEMENEFINAPKSKRRYSGARKSV